MENLNGVGIRTDSVWINDEKIAQAYLNEFEQVAALSEPLDWSSEYADPEWRIGT